MAGGGGTAPSAPTTYHLDESRDSPAGARGTPGLRLSLGNEYGEVMTGRLQRAREDVQRAAELTDNAVVHKQLLSIDEGLEEMTHSAKEDVSPTDQQEEGGAVKTEGDVPHDEKLRQVEAKLAGLSDDADGRARELIHAARNRLDDYRQADTTD